VAVAGNGEIHLVGSFADTHNLGTNSIISRGDSDIFHAKYDTNGTLIWIQKAGGIEYDYCASVAVDSEGFSVIAGSFNGSADFGGIPLSGHVYPARYNYWDWPAAYVAQYAPDGHVVWAKQLTTGYDSGGALSVAVDSGRNCLVFGRVTDTRWGTSSPVWSNPRLLVGKYDMAGNQVWIKTIASTNFDLTGNGIALDSAGNFYVSGFFTGNAQFGTTNLSSRGDRDIFIAKYNAAGDVEWAKSAGLLFPDEGRGLGVDSVGNIYATGYFYDSAYFDLNYITGIALEEIFIAKLPAVAPVPPTITGPPQSTSVRAGSNATFSVSAGGTLPLQYQWQFNSTNLFNATNSTLIIANVLASQAGPYRVIVSNTGGSITSAVATLAILLPPALTSQPESQVVIAGATVTFQTGASGTPPLYYQWSFNGTALPLATNATLVISNAQPANGGNYQVIVNNAQGTATSALASLTVRFALAVATTGQGQVTVNPAVTNYPPNLPVTLTATPALGYAFSHWSGSASGNANPLAVTMTTNLNVVANFVSTAITLLTQGIGTVTKSPDQPYYAAGNIVTLTASPARWFVFDRWGDGVTSNPRLITIGLSNSYTAIFVPTTAVETLTFNNVTRTAPLGMPAVFVDGEFVVTGAVGRLGAAQVSLLTTYSNGTLLYTTDGTVPSFLSKLYYGPFTLTRSATLRVVAYSADFRQSWEAEPVQLAIVPLYQLHDHTTGGGSVTVLPPGAPYTNNTLVTLTAAPATGWTFLQWLGDLQGTNASATATMTREKHVAAVFGTTLGVTVTGNGAVLAAPQSGLYPHGAVVKLTAVPQPGNYFALWGNAASSSTNPLHLTITNATPTVAALFAALNPGQHALTIIVNGGGQVTLSPQANVYNNGQTVTITATPDVNQDFLSWSGDATGVQNPLVVTMNQSRTITANFTRRSRFAVGPLFGGARENGFQFTVLGELGSRVTIEGSPDLKQWSPVVTLTNQFGVVQFTAPAGQPVQYYRLRNAP
jgi:hypothetical protein